MKEISVTIFKPFTPLSWLADRLAYYVKGLRSLGIPATVTMIHVPDDGTGVGTPIAVVDGLVHELRDSYDIDVVVEHVVKLWILGGYGSTPRATHITEELTVFT